MAATRGRKARQGGGEGPRGRRGKPKGPGSRLVFEALREQVLSLEIPPGTDIDEMSVAARYGVSRTPIREALIKLASEGLVSIVPNRGARVAPLDLLDTAALLEAAELCDRAINRWAASRRQAGDLEAIERSCDAFDRASLHADFSAIADANRDFHEAIARACRNKYLETHFRALSAETLRLARMAFTTVGPDMENDAYYATVRGHHRALFEAIRDRDEAAADRLAIAHTQLFRDKVLTFINNSKAKDIALG